MTNKTYLITGASGEIGSAISHELAQAGYNLVLTGNQHSKNLNSLKKELETQFGVKIVCYPCDLTNFQEVLDLKAYIHSKIGQLAGYIHAAGKAHIGLIQDMSLEEIDYLIKINLSAAIYLSKIFLPDMIRQQFGHIIHISSIWGNVGASLEAVYSSCKSGLNALTSSLAKEVGPSHIQVNAIAPGLVDTKMNGHLSEEEIQSLCEQIPVGRMCQAREVGQLCLQLIQSPTYLTGQIIQLDGGWL